MLTIRRMLPARRYAAATATRRFYSSSYHDRSNDGSNNNSKNEQDKEEIPPTEKANVQQQQQQQQSEQPHQQHLSFMPVINMPETEFAHNAFFSLHRPLLGLSSSEERPFFSTRSHPSPPNAAIREMLGISQPQEMEEEVDEALAQYMMQLRPFEPPQQHGEHDHHEGLEVRFDEALHIDQHLPTYYMPESDQVVDYLTAMQEKLEQHQSQPLGRRRGASRPVVYALTVSEARRKSLYIQQYRQRARRQRPIARLLIDRRNR